MTPDEARALVDGIRDRLGDLAAMITRAWEGRAWVALGYDTWALLCQHEFGGVPQLPSRERRKVVLELNGAGMSTRAIGQALDVDQRTVNRDVRQSASPAPVLGLDGKRYTPPKPRPTPQPVDPTAAIRRRAVILAAELTWLTTYADVSALDVSTRQALRTNARATLQLLDEIGDSR